MQLFVDVLPQKSGAFELNHNAATAATVGLAFFKDCAVAVLLKKCCEASEAAIFKYKPCPDASRRQPAASLLNGKSAKILRCQMRSLPIIWSILDVG